VKIRAGIDRLTAGKKFAPRQDVIRDAGLLYHASGTDKVWPPSVKFQIQKGDSGDIVNIKKGGMTWMRPDPANAIESQGEPGMLPEDGGFPADFGGGNNIYVGRYPDYQLSKWMTFYMKGRSCHPRITALAKIHEPLLQPQAFSFSNWLSIALARSQHTNA